MQESLLERESALEQSPDLLVEEIPGGRWRILRISSGLAKAAGLGLEQARGRSLDGLFPEAVPPLAEMARRALEESSVRAALRLSGDRKIPPLELLARFEGLGEGYRSRVAFFFRLARPAAAPRTFAGMIGSSPAMLAVFERISLYAASDASVVITGETGSGKELVARALHDLSARSAGPYVALNCSAVSEELLESELFGHEKGAFTGAVRSHRGRFERADRGSLFLDELGDMPLRTQAKLLRVLETGRVERVGAEQELRVDVRILCATHVALEQAVARGGFRADLYHRLAVLRIHLPPLRRRLEDIPLLVEHFLEEFSRKYGRRIERLTPEAMALLQSYLWPGNVRELRNLLERIFVETRTEVVGARAFSDWIRERREFAGEGYRQQQGAALIPPYPVVSGLLSAPDSGGLAARAGKPRKLDEAIVRDAYRCAQGNLSEAARLLGVHRATLYRWLERQGLSREELE